MLRQAWYKMRGTLLAPLHLFRWYFWAILAFALVAVAAYYLGPTALPA